MTSNRAEWFKK